MKRGDCVSIGMGTPGVVPNWIAENDWSPTERLNWLNRIMAFSSRDWSHQCPGDYHKPDPETWAIWCLSCCDTKNEAITCWNNFCEEHASEAK